MESMSINDLVILKDGYKAQVNEIITNFKKAINKEEIPRRQEGNLRKLASLFFNDVKVDKPIVVNLDIGQGKSTLLLEFIKYIYQVDSSFSTVIVKRTLQEGRDFCIDAGVKNIETVRERLNVCNDPAKELQDMYYGNGEYKHPQEDNFIARLLRGFNYNDCLEYKDPNQAKFAIGGDKLPSFFQEYSPVLCTNCPRICGAKLSKWTEDKHPAIVITHQRLFLSNDLDSIAENISGRKVLIIDEKIETKDIGNVLLEQWEAILTKVNKCKLSDKTKEEVRKIGAYLSNLQYPECLTDGIVKITPHDPTFKFDSTIYGILMGKSEDVQTLVAIEKFLNYGGTASRSWHKEEKKQFSYIRYIDLENYTKHFDKTIILDATSAIDEDYKKSNVVFLSGLDKTAQRKINLYYSAQRTSKHALIIDKNTKTNKEEKRFRSYKGNRKYYLKNVKLLANEIEDIITENGKTLVICYKSIVDKHGSEFKLEDDLFEMLKDSEVDSSDYSIRHFGAATTGVNDFRKYKNIVLIGMLNKSPLYYTNKTLAIGNGDSKLTELSEQVIDGVQQIGRICIREGEEANVYMLFEDKLGLTQELRKHFRVKEKEWQPKYFNGINNASQAKQETCWFAIINVLNKMIPGEYVRLKDIQEALPKFETDTVYRNMKHPQVVKFMNQKGMHNNQSEKVVYYPIDLKQKRGCIDNKVKDLKPGDFFSIEDAREISKSNKRQLYDMHEIEEEIRQAISQKGNSSGQKGFGKFTKI